MNKAFSIYLDLVRFLAACLVYIFHTNQRLIVSEILPISRYGHSAVVVFFVLSGYVIAYITATKENTLLRYTASRLSRIYSVAIPALVLTLLLDSIGRELSPALYDYPYDQFVVRLLAGLFFGNEIWAISITTFSNVPYWSICYEMWYYVAFALFVFLPRRVGLWAMAGLALVLGPKIVLLAPLWMLGVLLYDWKRAQNLSLALSWALLAISVAGIVLWHWFDLAALSGAWIKATFGAYVYKTLAFSQTFPADYLLGILVFINFIAMRRIAEQLGAFFLYIERPVRLLASYTLTLYLLHQPLFLFWAAVLQGDPHGYANWWRMSALTAASIAVIGYFTENKRQAFKSSITHALQRIPLMQRKVKARER